MKHIKLHITKGYVFSFVLALLGMLFLIHGSLSWNAAKHAYALDALTWSECSEGTYVRGNITNYIGIDISTAGKDRFTGVSVSWITMMGGAIYDVYTLPLADGKYISVYIKSDSILKEMEQLGDGEKREIYFEGEIVRLPVSLNYEWLKNAFGLQSEEEINALVSPQYAIMEMDFDRKTNRVKEGLALLATALLCFIGNGGRKNLIYDNSVAEQHTSIRIPRTCSPELMLEMQQEELELLYKRKKEMKKSLYYRIPFLFLGIFFLVKAVFLTNMLIGILLIFIFVKGAWRVFINSDLKVAKGISDLFDMDTLNRQIVECKVRIHHLTQSDIL